MAAQIGDDVTVRPGLYLLSETIDDPGQLTIHGVAGQPRPRVEFTNGVQKGLLLDRSTLRWLEVEQVVPGVNALNAVWSTLDQVVVTGVDGAACGASVYASTMRNSVVTTTDGSAICSVGPDAAGTSAYRNVTAVATGSGGVGIEAHAFEQNGSVTANLVNVIARGGAGGAGLWIHTDSMGGDATITATHTNYPNYWKTGTNTTYVDGGGNQGTPPQFVNPAAGNYREAPGSVTIAAGLSDPLNGAFDIDGDPREIGATDIGADEFVYPPTATTGPASTVGSGGATLTGVVSPKGDPTTYRFEYGTTASYGSMTPVTSAGSSAGAVQATAGVDGLSPATTYHYRVVATNSAGNASGADVTFTTAAASQPTSPGTTTTSAADAFAGVQLVSKRLTLAGRFVTVRLQCPAATAGHCTGRTRLTARRRRTRTHAAATVSLGKARFSIGRGGQAKVRVRISRSGRRLFDQATRRRGRATSAAHSDTGESRTTAARVTIHKPHRP